MSADHPHKLLFYAHHTLHQGIHDMSSRSQSCLYSWIHFSLIHPMQTLQTSILVKISKSVGALTSSSSIKGLHLNVAKSVTGMVRNCEGLSGDFWQSVLHSLLMVFRKVLNITSCTGLIFNIVAAVEEACPSTKQ